MISKSTQELLCCPICHAKLRFLEKNKLVCSNPSLQHVFPIIDGIPVLLNEKESVFTIDDFVQHNKTFFRGSENKFKKIANNLLPSISNNIKSKENYFKLLNILSQRGIVSKVLVLGGSIEGSGMRILTNSKSVELVESDVSFGPRTTVIVDAHDIPFCDKSFDGVIVQAVLEHVVDPNRCVEEIFRVLKEDGVVYAETPFMQQVHGGAYDFMRYTYLGHRRLFRKFEEIDSGAMCGAGMALAWAYQYFLLSFSTSKAIRTAVKIFSRVSSFYLKYFDYFLINKPGTLDAASGYYFMGRKSEHILFDKELIKLYKGAS